MTNQGKLGHRSVEIGSNFGNRVAAAAPSAYSKLVATARYPGNGGTIFSPMGSVGRPLARPFGMRSATASHAEQLGALSAGLSITQRITQIKVKEIGRRRTAGVWRSPSGGGPPRSRPGWRRRRPRPSGIAARRTGPAARPARPRWSPRRCRPPRPAGRPGLRPARGVRPARPLPRPG